MKKFFLEECHWIADGAVADVCRQLQTRGEGVLKIAKICGRP